jgi:dinuclear metal center YbgI/SA1388 family protein
MATRNNVTSYLDELLHIDKFKDYAPNGLQVEGKDKLKKIVTGVSATQALIDAAIKAQADMIIVHHGWFWKQEDPCITGMKYSRLKALMSNEISLLGYHLPLDAHPEFGNNAQLAHRLELHIEDVMDEQGVGNFGRLDEYVSLDDLGEKISLS